MENQPTSDERILEAIEACRPGSDDAADPALAYLAAALCADPQLESLYGRLQQVDAMLAGAFRDVPVPEGLQQRLIERLAAARAEHVATDEGRGEKLSEAAEAEPAAVAAPRPRRAWRRWLLPGGVAVTAAALLIAVLMSGSPSDPWNRQRVLREAIDVFQAEKSPVGFAANAPPSGYPVSRFVGRVPTARWRSIRSFLDRNGVAYDLSRGSVRAVLYVVDDPVDGLREGPPSSPYTTFGCSAAVWREKELMYVLVVDDDNPQVFSGFLVPPKPWA